MNQPTQPAKKQRIASRRTPKKSAKVACYKGSIGLGPNLALSLLDVSETGIRLVARSALEPGQEIVVELLGPGHTRPIKFLAEVAWSLATSDNTYCVGARFQRRMEYSDLQQLT